MTSWDAATVSAVVALIVAVVAMFVAIAQALQQYFITGQLIRLCDSVVFGPMPGKGHRVWQLSQFRFRVIYSMPQISLEGNLWPGGGGAITKSYATGRYRLPPLADPNDEEYDAEDSEDAFSDIIPAPLQEPPQRTGFRLSSLFLFQRKGRPPPTSFNSDGLSSYGDSIAEPYISDRRQTRNQLRFRGSGLHRRNLKPSSTGQSPGPKLSRPTSLKIGEASWVSFCRAIEFPCGDSVRIDLVTYDADRCPSDLVSAPMPVSMRDIVVMGLVAGMEPTSASFDEKTVSMQGAVGSLTTSSHPVLGPILHFTPRNINASVPTAFGYRPLGSRGSVGKHWLPRTWDVCSVARRFYNSNKRRTMRRLDDRWLKDNKGVSSNEVGMPSMDGKPGQRRTRGAEEKNNKGKGGHDNNDNDMKDDGNPPDKTRAATGSRMADWTPAVRSWDGNWTIILPLLAHGVEAQGTRNDRFTVRAETSVDAAGGSPPSMPPPAAGNPVEEISKDARPRHPTLEEVRDEGEDASPKLQDHQEQPPPPVRRRATVEDAVGEDTSPKLQDHQEQPPPPVRRRATVEDAVGEAAVKVQPSNPMKDRIETAKALQAARTERLRTIQKDKELVESSVKKGTMSSPYQQAAEQVSGSGNMSGGGPLLLTNYAYNDTYKDAHNDAPTPLTEEEAARERERKREEERLMREEARKERNINHGRAVSLTNVDTFWISQMDVTAGFWATTWHDPDLIPIQSALDGAVTVILEGLLGFLDDKSLVYTGGNYSALASFRGTAEWMFGGGTTYPAYALNAQGGVIAEGLFIGVRIPAFRCAIPVLELLHSYDWQVDSFVRNPQAIEERNTELMRLDSWLSYVGRTEEISGGPHQLLKHTPALVHLLMSEFEFDFQSIDLSAKEGGLQDIQGLAANVMDFLTIDEELNEAEQLYVLVALLRAVKVAQCVRDGSDTRKLGKILELDVQAHLV